jgi:hypothetical protein
MEQPLEAVKITLFLPSGDAKGLRIAEIGNWSGLAVAAPRTELGELLALPRLGAEEPGKPGVYILTWRDPQTDKPSAYIGESETIRERLKQHRTEEFWVAVVVFVGDESLTKAHVRYLEDRLLTEATQAGRFALDQNQAGGAKLPECDRPIMEAFLYRMRQLLPILGCDILVPVAQLPSKPQPGGALFCRVKGAEARGQRTADGFVVFQGSTAVLQDNPAAPRRHPTAVALRARLIADGTLVQRDGFLVFTKDAEFSSPSAAAYAVHGGGASGLTEWRSEDGTPLKQLDETA